MFKEVRQTLVAGVVEASTQENLLINYKTSTDVFPALSIVLNKERATLRWQKLPHLSELLQCTMLLLLSLLCLFQIQIMIEELNTYSSNRYPLEIPTAEVAYNKYSFGLGTFYG